MLQIISGRFFGDGQVEESDSDAVLYSGLSWVAPIETAVAQLRPVDGPGHAVTAYVLRYANRYETRTDDIMVLANPDEAVDQFRLLASFWFRAFFHPDRHHVELLCRPGPRNTLDDTIPRSFVPRFFEPGQMATASEAAGFAGFVAKVLAMPRKKYRLAIACLVTYFDALEAMGTNFDLAYGMMVYLLEALCQAEDGYAPVWGDYDQKVRGRLEEVFARIDTGDAAAIRSALLESAHLKLMKRFVGFIAGNVADEFFTTEAEGLTRALPRSKLEQSLRNLYNSRSGFVHQLKKVREQLRHPLLSRSSDVLDWDNEPHLTFPGLVRLVHHVLLTFITRQPVLEREDYPAWRDELPGTMVMEMAPQYWIWQVDGFTPQKAGMRLSGLLYHLAGMLASGNKSLPDMSALMQRVEELIGGCSPADRIPMLALYQLYNALAPEDGRRPRRHEILGRYGPMMQGCSIAFLSFWPLLAGEPIPWPVAECVTAFEDYQKKRYKAAAIHLPVLFEVAVMAAIANLCLEAGDRDSYAIWAGRAILDAAGRKPVQEMLAGCRSAFRLIDTRSLVGLPPAPEQTEEVASRPAAEVEGTEYQPPKVAGQTAPPG